MSDTPETPGKDVVFIKPNIPDCWVPEPVFVIPKPSGDA